MQLLVSSLVLLHYLHEECRVRRLSKKQSIGGHNTQEIRKPAGEDVMGSTNGVTATVEHETASALNGQVPSVERSEAPSDVGKQPSSAHDIQEVYRYEPARVRATDTQNWYLYTLAALVVVGFFVLTVLLMIPTTKISDDAGNKDIVFMLFGGLVTGFSMVLSYFFGSSAGSAQKTVELAKIAKTR
jgi:hypothetical protein